MVCQTNFKTITGLIVSEKYDLNLTEDGTKEMVMMKPCFFTVLGMSCIQFI